MMVRAERRGRESAIGTRHLTALTRRIYLLRHAKSAWDETGLADFQRPLAPRGARAVSKLRQHMAQTGVRPALVVCSGAVRARQTLAGVEAGLGGAEVVAEDALYLLGGTGLLDRLRRIDAGVGSVMLVGHNPGMHALAVALLADGTDGALGQRLRAALPTGALVTLDWDSGEDWRDLGPGTCHLTGFVCPKDL